MAGPRTEGHDDDERSTVGVAALDLRSCVACGSVCEVTGTFSLPAPDGASEPYVRTRCLLGHRVVCPAFAVQG